MKFPLSVMLLLLLTGGGLFTACTQQNSMEDGRNRVAGGSCTYQSYSGLLTIEKLQLNYDQVYKIYYKFKPDSADVPAEVTAPPSYPPTLTSDQVSKFGIKPGKQFKADVKYIANGPCAPGPYLSDPETWR